MREAAHASKRAAFMLTPLAIHLRTRSLWPHLDFQQHSATVTQLCHGRVTTLGCYYLGEEHHCNQVSEQ
jgi:hypothetical protein